MMSKKMNGNIIHLIQEHHPNTQAIYLFGSYGTAYEREDSDVDIAILLSHEEAKEVGSLVLSDLRFDLEDLFQKEVDLINLRQVSTVFQKEIIMNEGRIYCANQYATDEFEMLTMSYYQKLNEERAGIIEDILERGRVLA